MITVKLHSAGKKFGREWIFRNLSLELPAGSRLVILGGNGSGKSTLLQLMAGYITPNEGKCEYISNDAVVPEEDRHSHLSFASPYLQLIEEFTGLEMALHAQKFKPYRDALRGEELLRIAELDHARNKLIKQYSSGMKQRLKLALAILADTPLLLLDEPVSNLDKAAITWYQEMIRKYAGNRSIVVCSNAVEAEYFFCDRQVEMQGYKVG